MKLIKLVIYLKPIYLYYAIATQMSFNPIALFHVPAKKLSDDPLGIPSLTHCRVISRTTDNSRMITVLGLKQWTEHIVIFDCQSWLKLSA